MDDAKTTSEDVYEFKTSNEATPTSASPQLEETASQPKAEGENESTESISLGKRPAADNETEEDEDAKRRKKKEETPPAKETKLVTTATRLAAVRGASAVAKASLSHTPSKTTALASRSQVNSDRKSPSSPKGGASGGPVGSPGSAKGEDEGDCERLGPKVPPLKIVIPPAEADTGVPRNGKNNSNRHTALPYVVSSNSNDSEKDGSVSPTDPLMANLTEEQKTLAHNQRVLRSHRGAEPPSRPCSTGSAPPTVASPPAATPLPPATPSGGPSSSENSPGSKPEVAAAAELGGSPATPAVSTTPPIENAPLPSSSGSTKGSNPPTPTSGGGDDRSGDNGEISTPSQSIMPADLHPRKRKLKHRTEVKESKSDAKSDGAASTSSSDAADGPVTAQDGQHNDQPVKNCYQLYLDIRKQVERRRQSLFPVQPKPPQGFKDYLINRGAYLLASNAANRQIPSSPLPVALQPGLDELFAKQERDRHRLRLQHIIEKEKLVLSVEQEILRVHGRAARALANQSVPFSVCTVLSDKEVYNLFTPEQEEKDRNARSRYNGRLFLGWLQDVDDKWEKIKENMLLRHHNEAESLHAVQKMDWEWKMVELGLCTVRTKLPVPSTHVPIVHVSDDFDLLPA